MRNKRFLNFLTDGDLLRLNRDGLAQSGMAVTDVTARETAPTGGEISGVNITLDGAGDSDIYRLSTTAAGTGAGSITLNAVSESDPSKTASAVCTVSDSSVGGSVGATLAPNQGSAASFGAFTPGLGKDYYASTSANVISTAGDATLTVADP